MHQFNLRRTWCTWCWWWKMTHVELKNGRYRNMPHMWQSGEDAGAHQVTLWWWARAITGPGSASGCLLMTRASGHSIIHWCDVFEHYFQSSLVVPWSECSRCSELDDSACCSNQRSVNESTSHDGSFDHWNVTRELVEEKRKHHAHSLSRIAGSQGV